MENINCLQCKFRHPNNGNCMEVGGFCTAVSAAYCPLLRQYLGTLMTPEQVANAKTIIESAFVEDTSKAERIRKLLAADKDGRCVVLPCKVGDTVYRVFTVDGREPVIQATQVKTFGQAADLIGRIGKLSKLVSVFRTREEAERAMQEMEGAT